MPSTKSDKDIKVVARLTVSGGGHVLTFRQFDKAWIAANDLARAGFLPVHTRLDGFVRKDVVDKDEFVVRF